MSSKRLLIFDARYPLQKIRRELYDQRIYKWVYFGTDYARLTLTEQVLAPNARRVTIGQELCKTARELRRPFIEVIGKLGAERKSLAWWASRISEKNPFVSKLFLNACYAHLYRTSIDDEREDVCIIVESRALIQVIQALAGKQWVIRTYRVSLLRLLSERMRRSLNFLAQAIRLVYTRITRFAGAAYSAQLVRDHFSRGVGKPCIALFTWIDEGCLKDNGLFKDRYYGPLADYLTGKGYRVAVIAEIQNIKRPFREVVRFLEANNTENRVFIIKEAFFGIRDLLLPLVVFIEQRSWKFNGALLDGIDLSPLIEEEGRGQYLEGSVLNYPLFKRLGEHGVRIDLFIDTFEYMISEKISQAGIRTYYPGARTAGYQHFALAPNFLCSYPSESEFADMPFPDTVVCPGRFYKDVLSREGYPAAALKVGAALRYAYLRKSADAVPRDSGDGSGRRSILVPLALDGASAIELLHKVHAALKDMHDVQVLIKPHPFMPRSVLEQMLPAGGLAPNFAIVQKEMSELLSCTDIGIVLASSAVIDFIATGVPVIRVGYDTNIELDPIGWFDEEPLAFTSADIARKVRECWNIDRERKQSLQKSARFVLEEMFLPINDDTMQAFAESLKENPGQ